MGPKKLKKNLVAIFAHPDDEAFGPSGTIAKLAETYNVYLLCATKGEVGKSKTKTVDLYKIREKELLESAKILGIKNVVFLGFKDGELCNNLYHQLANAIEKNIKALKPEALLTYELKGVSGHLDHIAVSLVTTFVYKKYKEIKKLMYYCIAEREKKYLEDYFIYFPQGFKKNEVDEIVDVADYWQQKLQSIKAHKSQSHDGKKILTILEKMPKEEYFLTVSGHENI